MTGRPYRGAGAGFESAELSPPDPSDDAALFGLMLTHPDFVSEDAVFMADGRILAESDPAWRTVVGWHRGGGPLVLGLTVGPGAAALLVETVQLAEATADWPLALWDEVLAAYWMTADPSLREGVAGRWGLDGRENSVEAWTRAAWGETPAPGRACVGILAAGVSPGLRRAVAWFAAGGREVAAFEVQRIVVGNQPTYWTTLVAGAWYRSIATTSRGEGQRREMYLRHTGSVTAGLLSAVEARCLESGSEVAWSGQEWVRFDGPSHSLRVFPGAGWVDLQFVGADEGTLTGLRYRYGVPRRLSVPKDAPPGVHLRLASAADFSPAVELLLAAWLGSTDERPDRREAEAVAPEEAAETPAAVAARGRAKTPGIRAPARAPGAGRRGRSG